MSGLVAELWAGDGEREPAGVCRDARPARRPDQRTEELVQRYMPATYQATVMRSQGNPILDLAPQQGLTKEAQRRLLDELRVANEEHEALRQDNSNLSARIASYELAYKMQAHAPEAVDLSQETEATQKLYGLDNPKTAPFGKQCLLARRLVERGVRFVQIYSGGAHNDDNWDAHSDMEFNHNLHCGETDLPIAGLLTDLKQRGLLNKTIIVWAASSVASQPPNTPRGPAAITTVSASRPGWRAAASRAAPATARPTNWEARPSRTAWL